MAEPLDRTGLLPSRKMTQMILKQTALEAIDNGWKVDTVAGVLNISRRTLFRWLAQQKAVQALSNG